MESYSRGRRGAPAKGVGVEMRARVQIPHSPPKACYTHPISDGVCIFFCSKLENVKTHKEMHMVEI